MLSTAVANMMQLMQDFRLKTIVLPVYKKTKYANNTVWYEKILK